MNRKEESEGNEASQWEKEMAAAQLADFRASHIYGLFIAYGIAAKKIRARYKDNQRRINGQKEQQKS